MQKLSHPDWSEAFVYYKQLTRVWLISGIETRPFSGYLVVKFPLELAFPWQR